MKPDGHCWESEKITRKFEEELWMHYLVRNGSFDFSFFMLLIQVSDHVKVADWKGKV